MSQEHDFRYDLRVEGADQNTLNLFHAALKQTVLGDILLPYPDDPDQFSTEVSGGSASFYTETIEDQLHYLATEFPHLKLHLSAEDLDDPTKSFDLIFHGDLYQRSIVAGKWTDFTPPCPYEQRQEALLTEDTRRAKADMMIQHLCKETDYDLLYAQKQALLRALHSGEPIPADALHGLIHFLDEVGDLGEVLGRFRYDGIEPPFPMLPEYEKKTVVFEPSKESQKIHLLCEEREDGDAIREFTVLAASRDEEGLKKLLAAKKEKDEYGLIARNGLKDSSPYYFTTNFDEFNGGFVEYYIFEEELLSPEKLQQMLHTPEYSMFQYPKGLQDLLKEVLQTLAKEEDLADLNIEDAVNWFLSDPNFQNMVKKSDWRFSEVDSQSPYSYAASDCTEFISGCLKESNTFFEDIGVRPVYSCSDALKEILQGSIYDVCRDYHLPIENAELQATAYIQRSAFRTLFPDPQQIETIERDSDDYMDAVWTCYDYAENQILQEKGLTHSKPTKLDRLIQAAERRIQTQSTTPQKKPDFSK